MMLIDRLCYQSKLRYVNASEKFVYAMLTLVLCIVSRSPAVAAAAFAVNGLLTVGAGRIRVLSREYPPVRKEIIGIAVFEGILLFMTIWSRVR